ncbi:hypothetical protein JCM14469_18750 [Desulfatiferula olefinivorans]
MKTDNSKDKATALVINDDITQLDTLCGLLRKNGIDAMAFESAEDALVAMNDLTQPDLIITDLYMPGIDGWRLCRLLRSPEYATFNEVPILVVSATFAGEEASRITADLGANAFLPSPVDGKRFIALVRSLLAGQLHRNQLKVLIVEDSKTHTASLKKYFVQQGYYADIVSDAASAITVFKNDPYDVAVIDYHLPDGNGDVLLEQFKVIHPDVVCIMITTDPAPELALAWMRKGAAANLHRPFEPAYLLELCVKARRERDLLRIKHLLEDRTRELLESEAKYRRLAENSPAVIFQFRMRPDGTYSFPFLSRVMPNVTGLSAESVMQDAYIFLHKMQPEDQVRFDKSILKSAQTLKPWHGFARFLIHGNEKWIEGHSTPERQTDGSCLWDGFLFDITRRVSLQNKLQQVEKTEGLSRMAGAIAHIFNNQLAAIIGNLEMLKDDLTTEKNDSENENLREARQAADQAAETSGFLLSLLGQDKGNPVQLDLAYTCRKHMPKLKAGIPTGVTIILNLPDSGPVIKADRSLVHQVIGVLVTNAWEAQEVNGRIQVKVHTTKADEIAQTNRFPVEWEPSCDSYACLEVIDDGRGMGPDIIHKIFDPFFTDKFTGRGLGLAVALGNIKSCGGCITVKSVPGQGSIFQVYWPLSIQSIPLLNPGVPEAIRTFETGGIVLLVDDQKMMRNMASNMLVRLGFEVITAKSGRDALKIFKNRQEEIRLVLTDLTMPGLNGWKILEGVRKVRPDIPVILASGYDEASVMSESHPEKPQAFLNKPYRKTDLAAALACALGSLPESVNQDGQGESQ